MNKDSLKEFLSNCIANLIVTDADGALDNELVEAIVTDTIQMLDEQKLLGF